MLKKIFSKKGCLVFVGVIILLVVASGAYVYFKVTSLHKNCPDFLKTPEIQIGGDAFKKTKFITDPELGSITDIAINEAERDSINEIVIAGTKGAIFVDRSGTNIKRIVFADELKKITLIDADDDGVLEYMENGTWGKNVAVLNHDGDVIWKYGGRYPRVNDMDIGDMDGDGIPEYVVGFNGGGGIHLLDNNGKKIWQQKDSNVWNVVMVDRNGDGKDEIMHSNAGGKMVYRDEKGEIETVFKPEPYFSRFSIVELYSKPQRSYAITAQGKNIWLLDFNGDTIEKYYALDSTYSMEPKATGITIDETPTEYLAVLVRCMESWKRSVLYIYDDKGIPIYREILDGVGRSVASLPPPDGGAPSILVGVDDMVWKYDLNVSTKALEPTEKISYILTTEAELSPAQIEGAFFILKQRFMDLKQSVKILDTVVLDGATIRLTVEVPKLLENIEELERCLEKVGKVDFINAGDEHLEDGVEVDYEKHEIVFSISDVRAVRHVMDRHMKPAIEVVFKDNMAFGRYTERNIGSHMAVAIDGVVVSCPTVTRAVYSGKAILTGTFSEDDVVTTASILNNGPMPVKFKIKEKQTH